MRHRAQVTAAGRSVLERGECRCRRCLLGQAINAAGRYIEVARWPERPSVQVPLGRGCNRRQALVAAGQAIRYALKLEGAK